MSNKSDLPRILVIDDLFGRTHVTGRNEERAGLCGQYRIEDVTGDEIGKNMARVNRPIAQAVFFRGQTPVCASVGDMVENDLNGVLRIVRAGWINHTQPRWALALLDLCFYTGRVTTQSDAKVPGMPKGREGDDDHRHYFGLRALEALHHEFPDLPIVILSSKPRGEVSRDFVCHGALGFLPRNEGGPEVLQDYLWRHGLIPDEQGEIVGQSKATLLMLRAARRAARSRRNILLRGERGTGKDLMARYIWRCQAAQSGAGLLPVNSAILSGELFASELFGIEKRTATGVDERPGLIEQANGGDLFFDEIKDMPPQVQAAILRAIEYREVMRVGARQPRQVNVRFISATNADIEAYAATERFLPDLLDRLREGGAIYLPPLRERREDLPLLVERFVREAERAIPGAREREIDPSVIDALGDHEWPGNIRDLRSCIFDAVSNYSDVEHLMPLHLSLPTTRPTPTSSTPVTTEPAVEAKLTTDLRLAHGIDELISALDQFDFAALDSAKTRGKLDRLHRAFADLLIRYLAVALRWTRDPLDGKHHYTSALKWMTGERAMPTSKAADLVKTLIKTGEKYGVEITDPAVLAAFESARRLRR